ncbi:hypothetical protein [Bacillus sinesaloumensis]|uniref:hypothetical protein n=1 Tax=Litchfieldia sinesaloumensis TaxID=1926280 RepID=UPI00098892F2|nr:hypothetical protein [Bacillus sinesaloumensis]
MNIHLIIFVASMNEEQVVTMKKTFQSDFRPVEGDIIDDPGFSPQFHNGYEVVKVTVNYATEECWVSLAPLAVELEEISIEEYVEKLQAHGWQVFEIEE